MLSVEQIEKNFRSNFISTVVHYEHLIDSRLNRTRCELEATNAARYELSYEAIKHLTMQLDILIQDKNVTDIEMFNKFLTKSKLKVHDDFTNLLKENHVVEIYSLDSFQQFRTPNFFKFIKYSISELYTYNWDTLYTRPKYITNLMFQNIKLATTELGKVHNVEIPIHVLKHNLIKNEGKICHMKFEYITACYDENYNLYGIAVASTAELLDAKEDDFNFL